MTYVTKVLPSFTESVIIRQLADDFAPAMA